MLSKGLRLNQEQDITRVLRKGQRFSTTFFTFYCLPSSNQSSRFGFLVSKKVSLRTNRRNLIKRQLRSIIRSQLPYLYPRFDCLIVAKSAIADKKFPQIESALLSLLTTAGIKIPQKTI